MSHRRQSGVAVPIATALLGSFAVSAALAGVALLAALSVSGLSRPTVHAEVEPIEGSRKLEVPTQASVIRNYLEAWQALSEALDQNRAELLDSSFVGTAKTKLADTIREQVSLGLRTDYRDRAHNLAITFYSPEGLSIQLVDNVEYDVDVFDQDKLVDSTPHIRARYVAIMTPTESRWKVRVLQAEPN